MQPGSMSATPVPWLSFKNGNTWEVLGRLLSRYFRKLRTETKTRFIGGFLVRGTCAVPIIIVRRMRCTYFCAQQYGRRSLWQRSPGCPGDFVALKRTQTVLPVDLISIPWVPSQLTQTPCACRHLFFRQSVSTALLRRGSSVVSEFFFPFYFAVGQIQARRIW